MSAIAHWVRLRADQLSQELPLVCKQGSYAATSGNVLRSLDAQQVPRVIALFVTRRTSAKWCGEEVSRLLT